MSQCNISFNDSQYSPVGVHMNKELSESLTTLNSPILFGCRTGICGTCLVRVLSGTALPEVDEDEKEILDVFYPGQEDIRLACRIKAIGDLKLEFLGQK